MKNNSVTARSGNPRRDILSASNVLPALTALVLYTFLGNLGSAFYTHPAQAAKVRGPIDWSSTDSMVQNTYTPFQDDYFSTEVAVLREGHVRFYNFTKNGDAASTDPDSIFGINSMTKVFVDLVLAQMVIEKKVKLDEPVQKYLHKYFPGASLPTFEGRPITFRTLATQSSGLPLRAENIGEDNAAAPDPYATYTDAQLFDYLKRIRLTFTPGSKYQYSNLGFGILGCVLAKIDDRDFSTLIEERISKPLALSDTHAYVDPETKSRLVAGHTNDGTPLAPRVNNECLKGSSSIRSSAKDMIKFLGFEVSPSNSPFPDAFELSQQATRNQINHHTVAGYAWEIQRDTRTHAKWGDGVGFSSEMFFNREHRTAMVVLKSSDPRDPKKSTIPAEWKLFTKLK